MRVIAGKKRGTVIKTIKGDSTRPTTDRIKETLFNMISTDLADSRFLDLFAGSGQIGIEALSRGAGYVAFVDFSAEAISCIKDNVNKCRLEDYCDIIKANVFNWLSGYNEIKGFDIIFIDPPYSLKEQEKLLELISQNDLLNVSGMIILEASAKNNIEEIPIKDLKLYKVKNYKTNKHIFFKKQNEKSNLSGQL